MILNTTNTDWLDCPWVMRYWCCDYLIMIGINTRKLNNNPCTDMVVPQMYSIVQGLTNTAHESCKWLVAPKPWLWLELWLLQWVDSCQKWLNLRVMSANRVMSTHKNSWLVPMSNSWFSAEDVHCLAYVRAAVCQFGLNSAMDYSIRRSDYEDQIMKEEWRNVLSESRYTFVPLQNRLHDRHCYVQQCFESFSACNSRRGATTAWFQFSKARFSSEMIAKWRLGGSSMHHKDPLRPERAKDMRLISTISSQLTVILGRMERRLGNYIQLVRLRVTCILSISYCAFLPELCKLIKDWNDFGEPRVA